jgi:ferric-dicitrate binding protein FerR (iron transport regulator)
MNKIDARQIRTAHEAATWFQRLEKGLSQAELWRYLRWLKRSPGNAEAISFMQRLVKVLRAGRKATTRH